MLTTKVEGTAGGGGGGDGGAGGGGRAGGCEGGNGAWTEMVMGLEAMLAMGMPRAPDNL